MNTADRKQAIKDFKARKPHRGIYSVRCLRTGTVWTGASRDLRAARNSLWFGLNHGSCLDRALQSEWDAQGEDAFEFSVLEALKEDVHELSVRDLLKEKQLDWAARLGARRLL
ncbi:MAG TPA: GIY-YIG nuclease family protein [Bryobacteraceae bacterium]|nr:GIY-YIG nuclease family protein [Bryobacteraceae bacterium]HPT27456.1 GIY-YIG nuclease family protein [Bryobacteraceae bacterium]